MNVKKHIIFNSFYPVTELSSAIDFFYYNYGEYSAISHFQTPFLHQEMVINLGDTFQISDLKQKVLNRSLNFWVSGIQTVPLIAELHGKHRSVGILFKPWGIHQIFGTNSSELLNEIMPGECLEGNYIKQFITDNQDKCFDSQFFIQLESYILKKYKLTSLNHQLMQSVGFSPKSQEVPFNLKSLSAEYRLASKTLIGHFNRAIGLSPNKYFNFLRVLESYRLIEDNPKTKLTQLASKLGFFDQSHFIRVFKSFCDITPSVYKKYL